MVFCAGLSLFLAAASVFFRDVIHLWSVILTAWMYATPLFYPYTILPGWMQALEKFNPMYLYVTFIRDIMLWNTMPTVGLVFGCVLSAVVALLVGIFVFKKNEHKFILYI
jgi:ABC-2 type transport system permease protein